MPEIFNLKDYISRQDLESHVNALLGQNIKENREAGHQIVGTKSELKQFQLSDTCVVFGVKVVSSEETSEKYKKIKK